MIRINTPRGPFLINRKQYDNLIRLMEYLNNLPKDYKHFNMYNFYKSSSSQRTFIHCCETEVPTNKNYINKCGTVACAVGHGPAAGIKPLKHETWTSYIERNFGLWPSIPEASGCAFEYLFEGEWYFTDDTPKGAAQRIYYMIYNGKVPNNYREQMRGEVKRPAYKRIKIN